VAHVIIDGTILTDKIKSMFGGKKQVVQTPGGEGEGNVDESEDWLEDERRRLDPTSIAKVREVHFDCFVKADCLSRLIVQLV
jgi:hypothetical protein